MTLDIAQYLEDLKSAGWKLVRRRQTPPSLKQLERSCNLKWPKQLHALQAMFRTCCNRDETAWFITFEQYLGTDRHAAFRWNEWEALSLEQVPGDQKVIEHFWSQHIPILNSVRSGYAYCALNIAGGQVVVGHEPEFESSSVVSASMDVFLKLVVDVATQRVSHDDLSPMLC